MWMKLVIWAIVIGSLFMGYFGYKTGSIGSALVGMGIFMITGFALFFLVKTFLHFGLVVGKYFLIFTLVILVAVAGWKGFQHLLNHGEQINTQQTEVVRSFNNQNYGLSLWDKTKAFFSFAKTGPVVKSKKSVTPVPQSPLITQPKNIQGTVSDVRSGYFFKLGKHYIKLYGIDAPDPKQTCKNKHGSDYNCGHQAKVMLEKMILGKNISCKIAGSDMKQNYIAVCQYQGVDIGAALVSAGWAVANRIETDVYIPYEEDAHIKKSGLWAGKFVAPWKARQKQKNIQSQSQKESGFFEGLFQ